MKKPPSKNPLKITSLKLAQIVSVSMGIITLVLAIFSTWTINNGSALSELAIQYGLDGGIKGRDARFQDSINSLKDEQKRLNERIDALSKITDQTALSAEVSDINNSVDDINNRLSKIENILVQDPQKALEIPLMRKDIDNLVSTTDLQIALLRQDIERSYNLMLVTIVALAIGVLAPALGNIFKKDEKDKE